MKTQTQEALVKFLLENPKPTDAQFHAFAMSINVDKEELEASAYSMLGAFLKRFFEFKNVDSEMFDGGSLQKAYASEMQFLEEPLISMCVAKAMLIADPGYYDDLAVEASVNTSGDTVNGQRRRANQNVPKSKAKVMANSLVGTSKSLDVVRVRQQQVSDEMDKLCTQVFLDHTVLMLNADGFTQEASNLSAAYADIREAMLTNAEAITADPLTRRVRNALARANNRDGGDVIRISYARLATNGMRELNSKYGSGSKGQYFINR